MSSRDGFVVVRTFTNRFEADVAKSALEAAAIETFINADDFGGTQPGLWLGRGVDLLVREEDADRAQDVLRDRPHSI
jgi:hypothetical protein